MNQDEKYINECFKLAKKGHGFVSPNPLVGAVLVKNGKVIGKGFHKKYGSHHAEIDAIKNAKQSVSGSTLYCNLEPCCHTNKQNPPCVPFIIQKKIERVVISNLDPNQYVNGKGVKQLRDAGIEVTSGVLEAEGKELNKFYFKYVETKSPYVTIKIAQSIDGKISAERNKQTRLTGKESVRYVHKLRSEHDAVLVGAGTIKTDNPLLTVRESKGRNPIRIIIDGKLSSPITSSIFNCEDLQNTWIFTSTKTGQKKVQKLKKLDVKVFTSRENSKGQLNIRNILQTLAQIKINSILVEGGANIFTQFLNAELFDEIIVLQSPIILGKGISGSYSSRMTNLQRLSSKKLGNDTKLVFGKKYSP